MTDAAPTAAARSDAIVELAGVRKSYGAEVVTEVLHGIDLVLRRGELVALIGPSGSGKSTLLNLLGLLDRPTAGTIRILGRDSTGLDDDARTALRGRSIGFVFQFHHLIPALTAAENVMMPLALARGRIEASMHDAAVRALAEVGLGDRAGELITRLSGGQQQRVAVARALVARPPLLLADEPTGNLDTAAAEAVFALMRRVHVATDSALLIVTHDPRLAARCERVIELVDGRIASDHRGEAAGTPA